MNGDTYRRYMSPMHGHRLDKNGDTYRKYMSPMHGHRLDKNGDTYRRYMSPFTRINQKTDQCLISAKATVG